MASVGDRVGSIRLVQQIGRGGMGEVFAGHDERLDRLVAVKTIRRRRAWSESAKRLFLREARILSSIEHEWICRVYDYLETDEDDFLVMELVEGETLSAALARGMSAERQLEVAQQLAEVLRVVHARGIAHRDLKPGNVMLTEGGIKVLDFGIARSSSDDPTRAWPDSRGHDSNGAGFSESVSGSDEPVTKTWAAYMSETELDPVEPGAVVGTPSYMSPEQASGFASGPASDLYSLGLILQSLFSRRPPHPSDLEPGQLLERARTATRDAATDLPVPIARLIDELTQRDPEKRATASQAGQRLAHFANRGVRRLRLSVAAAVVLLSLGAAVKYTVDLGREREAALRARDEAVQATEAADAARQQAEEATTFLIDLFEGADPVEAGASDPTVRQLLDRGTERVRGELADEPELRFTMLSTIAVAYRNLGDFEEARRLYDEAITSDEFSRSPALVRARLFFGVGQLDRIEGHLEAARESFRDALAQFGASHASSDDELGGEATAEEAGNFRLAIRNELGNLASLDGDYDDALAQYQEVRAELVALGLGESRQMCNVLGNIGGVMNDMGRYDEATAIMEEALPLFEQHFGEVNPITALLLNNLGISRSLGGDDESARAAFERSLEIRLATLDETHPSIGQSYINLAGVTEGPEAIAYARRGYELTRAAFGDHVQASLALQMLAGSQHEAGDLEGAFASFDEAEQILDRLLPDEHPRRTELEMYRIPVLIDAGRLEEAKAKLLNLLAKSRQGDTTADLDEAEVLVELSVVSQSLSQHEEARQYARQAREFPLTGELEEKMAELEL